MSGTIIVTGAAGFIGRNTVAELNRRGCTAPVLVDNLGCDEKWKNLAGLQFEDLLAPSELLSWLQATPRPRVDAIIHLGACSSTTESNADFLMENNYRYTRRLCKWALTNSSRFIYASSAATYGDGSLGFSDADANTKRLMQLNMYGYSKHVFDLWALRHSLLDQIVGLKFFNVFGPYESHKGDMRSVVAKANDQIKDAGEVALFKSYRDGIADGEQRRDFIYVDDAVDVVMHFLDKQTTSGLFNCGSGVARTWLDLAHAVFAALDRPANIRFIDMPPSLRAKYQYFTQADIRKLRACGYNTEFRTLEQGVDEYVRTYLALAE
ncbi:MAG: ADP-glyceromanno-heptose 6-epimerase [Actinobacteria bacterium]|nr:ADP-glyceromanno-heptose 6-epimerase [Actinomycetota bacterium]